MTRAPENCRREGSSAGQGVLREKGPRIKRGRGIKNYGEKSRGKWVTEKRGRGIEDRDDRYSQTMDLNILRLNILLNPFLASESTPICAIRKFVLSLFS